MKNMIQEKRKMPSIPVTSFNKESTFPDKQKSNNKETPLKQPHMDIFTPEHKTLERIKHLYIKCGFLCTEHLFIITINWLEYQ